MLLLQLGHLKEIHYLNVKWKGRRGKTMVHFSLSFRDIKEQLRDIKIKLIWETEYSPGLSASHVHMWSLPSTFS